MDVHAVSTDIQTVRLISAIRRLIKSTTDSESHRQSRKTSQMCSESRRESEPFPDVPKLPQIAMKRSVTFTGGSVAQDEGRKISSDTYEFPSYKLKVSTLLSKETKPVKTPTVQVKADKISTGQSGVNYSHQLQVLKLKKQQMLGFMSRFVDQKTETDLSINGTSKSLPEEDGDTSADLDQMFIEMRQKRELADVTAGGSTPYTRLHATLSRGNDHKTQHHNPRKKKPDIIIPCHTNTVCEFCQLYDDEHDCPEEKTPKHAPKDPQIIKKTMVEEKKARDNLNKSATPFKNSSRRPKPKSSHDKPFSSVTEHFLSPSNSVTVKQEETIPNKFDILNHTRIMLPVVAIDSKSVEEEKTPPSENQTRLPRAKGARHKLVGMDDNKKPVYKLCYTKSAGRTSKAAPPLLYADILRGSHFSTASRTQNINMAFPSPAPSIQPPKKSVSLAGEPEPASRAVTWSNTIEKDMAAINRAKTTIGISQTLSTSFQNGEQNGVKYISLASPMNSADGSDGNMKLQGYNGQGKQQIVLQNLPIRATLHRAQQIPGRFFPSPSYTEFQRDVIDSKPTPRRIIRKFKAKKSTDQLFPSGSPVKPRTVMEKSTWIANQVYNRGSHTAPDPEKPTLMLPPEPDGRVLNPGLTRQYSIPAKPHFRDGRSDTLITGSTKTLHAKHMEADEAYPVNKLATVRAK